MKKLVWVAGAVLLFAVFFPNGINLPFIGTSNSVTPIDATPDQTIVGLLRGAAAEDRARIRSVYAGMKHVLQRDKGERVSTTEKFAEVHANTLQLAIDKPGKYPGLDDAIESVFIAAVGQTNLDPTVVNAITPEMQAKLITACDVIIVSSR